MGVRKDNVIRTSKNTALISGFGVGDIKSAEIKLTFEQGGWGRNGEERQLDLIETNVRKREQIDNELIWENKSEQSDIECTQSEQTVPGAAYWHQPP